MPTGLIVADFFHYASVSFAENYCRTLLQTRRAKGKCLLGGPEERGNAMSPLHSRGCPTPSAGRKSEVATSPLPSWAPQRGWKCYITPAFSWVPNAKHGEKIRSGYLTPAFLGTQKRAEVLCHPYILRALHRQARGQNENWPAGGHIAYNHAFSANFVFCSLRYSRVIFFALNVCRKNSSFVTRICCKKKIHDSPQKKISRCDACKKIVTS